MKNTVKITCFLFTVLGCGLVNGQQSAFYDALFISKNCIDPDEEIFIHREDLLTILKKYYPPETELSEEILKNNPFFQPYVPVTIALSVEGSVFKETFSSIGNLNVTNFADGLAKFLVARAKEELNVAFFRRFQEFLKKYPEVEVIFPSTYEIITNIYSYQYTAFLPALRASFYKDLNDFGSNLITLRDLTADECPADNQDCQDRINALNKFLNEDPIGKTSIAGLIVSDQLMKGSNAADVLEAIHEDRICFEQTDNFSNCVRFANLLSTSLRSNEESEVWVNKKELNELLTNKNGYKIFLGLLYAANQIQDVPITFSIREDEVITFENILKQVNDNASEFTQFKAKVKEVGYLAAETSLLGKKIMEQNESSESSILIYADYAATLSEWLQKAVSFLEQKHPQLGDDVSLFTSILDDAVDACYDIKSHNYTSLVIHTSQILDTLLQGDYPFRDDYVKYGTFMANIVEADNSDEVKAAIEAAVLPVGSASIKRETFSNITLNAFIGPMAGTEYLGAQKTDQWAPVVGVTAPLGVAFNWGNYGNGKRKDPPEVATHKNGNEIGGKSLTLFIPLIDVGSIATYRLSDDSSNVAADIKLENIIAPGLYFYYGFGKIPLSLGIGGQVGPQLREINATDINVDKNFYVRFGLNLVVDIPFFNFYTRN